MDRLQIGIIAIVLFHYCVCQEPAKSNEKGNNSDARLGLLAQQLGLSPVAGYSETGANIDVPAQNYGDTSSSSSGSASYSSSQEGIHGGNLVSPHQCQCVPAEQCPSYNGGGSGGGSLPPPPPGDNYGSGGQHDGGSYGGSQGGGIVPIPGPNDGQHGGNINPVIGGENGGPYGDDGPNTDGSGLLDLRIVNRPLTTGGVQCLNGQVFCCDLGANQGGKPPYQESGGQSGSGYATCGTRQLIDTPGKPLEYGDAKFGAYPWMAVILGKGNNYVGAAAVISPYYVLTAAHKIKSWKPGAAYKVRFGEWNAKEDDEPYKNVEIEVADVLIHPGFNLKNLQNDIALVRLAKPIDVKGYPHIKAACLPQGGYHYTGQRCWVAGFGKDAFGTGKHSYIMKEVDLPILDSNDCEQRLRTTRLGNHFQLNRQSFICAGGEEGKDACTGDGGSPLVCETGKGGVWEVVGLVAWGIGCADYGIPGVYVNVPSYLDWINENIYKY